MLVRITPRYFLDFTKASWLFAMNREVPVIWFLPLLILITSRLGGLKDICQSSSHFPGRAQWSCSLLYSSVKETVIRDEPDSGGNSLGEVINV